MKRKYLPHWLILLLLVFLYMPILVLIIYSFNEGRTGAKWTGFTLRWYMELFRDRNILRAMGYTILIAFIASTFSTIAGTITAWGIRHMKRRSSGLLLSINDLPLLNPDLVTAISLMSLYIFLKMTFGFMTLLLAHIMFSIPYVIITVLPVLRRLSRHQMEAALDLGARPVEALFKIILPQLKQSIISGWLIAFTMSIDDFVISFFTTGSGVSNISIAVFSMARRGINPKINALSSLMFATVIVLLLIINKNRKSRKEDLAIEENILLH
ncbi:ABC transporter permease [Spirochaeta isovalerica]|uniref:Spermidine/putrescine transport system permease protein n=1 Tax=Spirochaeta isovalerica TaxID=150 RepID=A0A841REV2_9SPIO|nr:ABC transporter permease [Spirochaeta isovalerica]MBB6481359.1 spermidine/putrescine transport system permease protein [Spirochaeta isovalerica]